MMLFNKRLLVGLFTFFLCATPVVYGKSITLEGSLGIYSFSPDEWQGLAPADPNPSRQYHYNVPHDGTLQLWVDRSTSEPVPPFIYIDLGSGWVSWYQIGIPYYSRGTSMDILVESTSYSSPQAGSLMYRFIYDDGQNVTHSLEADFTVTPENPDANDEVSLVDNSRVEGAYITSRTWSLNGVEFSQYQDYTTVPLGQLSPGSYQATLLVEDSHGGSDDYTYVFEVTVRKWVVIDSTTCTEIQASTPFDALNRKSSFTLDDDINAWIRLGNLYEAHKVTLYWTSSDFTQIKTTSINIPNPFTQGYEYWSDYTIWDTVSVGSSEHNAIISKPGSWYVSVYVDDVHIRNLDFSISGNLELTLFASVDKLFTGDATELSGTLSLNGNPIPSRNLDLNIYRSQQLLTTIPVTTDSSGGFTSTYIIPKIMRDFPPSGPETWSVQTLYTGDEYGSVSSEIALSVLPVWVEVTDMVFVQVVADPVITDWGGTNTYLAASKEFVLRTYFNVKGFKTAVGFSDLSLDFKLTYGFIYDSTSQVYIEPVIVDKQNMYVDTVLILGNGKYEFKAEIDPDGKYFDANTMNLADLDKTKRTEYAISKEMDTLKLIFIPIRLQLDDVGTRVYHKKVNDHLDVIRATFPLPEGNLRTIVYDVNWPTIGLPTKYAKRLEVANMLNLIGFFERGKVVAVVPSNTDWLDPKTPGASFPLLYRVGMVREDASRGTSAHEIAHTYGVNSLLEGEQYKNHPPRGKQVTGLISKKDSATGIMRVFNMSVQSEKEEAFGHTDPSINSVIPLGEVFCFMGNAPESLSTNDNTLRDIQHWVSTPVYSELLNALKDPPVEPLLYVSGYITSEGAVNFNPLYSTLGVYESPEYTDYTLRSLSEDGTLLFTTDFGFKTDEGTTFAFEIPKNNSLSRIEVYDGSQKLATLAKSPTKPVTSNIQVSPTGDDLHVTWSSSDGDQDPLVHTILYSNDMGASWTPVSVNLTESNTVIDGDLLRGGAGCLFKVVTSDGFDTVESISGTFSVADAAPSCLITTSETAVDQTKFLLEAILYDREDGYLTNIAWVSSIDGYLGEGDSLIVPLSSGTHTITCSGEDTNGNIGADAVIVQVSGQNIIVTGHYICQGVDDQGNPLNLKSSFNSDESVVSYLTLEGASMEQVVEWVFNGPNGLSETSRLTLEHEGEVYVFSSIDLWTLEGSSGDWAVTVFIDDVESSVEFFTVEEPVEEGFKIGLPRAVNVILVITGLIVYILYEK